MFKKRRKLRHDVAYITLLTIVFVSKKTPRLLGLQIFGFMGLLLGFILKKERSITQQNLKNVFKDYDDKQIDKIVNGVFINAGKSLFDSIKLPEYPKEKFFKIIRLENESLCNEIFSSPKSAIVLGSHLSAFELKTHIVAKMGYKAMTIGSSLFDKKVEDLLIKLRKRNNVEYFDRNGGIMNVLRNLRNGFNFGVLVDQDATHEGVFVNFLGEEAFTPFIPVKIAIRNDFQLVWAFLIREKREKYTFYMQKAEIIETEDEMETYILNLEKFSEKLGEFIIKYPQQWVWMHNRWKRKSKDFPKQLSISYYKEKKNEIIGLS